MAKYKLLLPKMGESVAEATIIKWTKNPGDYIETDETVMEIATDKVDSDVPSPVSGKLLEQLFKENDVVQVGAVIAIIETDEPEEAPAPQTAAETQQQPLPVELPDTPYIEPVVEHTPEAQPVQQAYRAPETAPQQEHKTPEENKEPVFTEQKRDYTEAVPFVEHLTQLSAGKGEEAAKGSLRFYSPLVKNIASQEGISNAELDQIPGTGAEGRLTKDDLLSYLQNRHKHTPIAGTQTVEEEAQTPQQDTYSAPAATAADEEIAEQPRTPEQFVEISEEPAFETPVIEPVAEAPQPPPVPPKPEPVAPKPEAPKPAPAVSVTGGDEVIEMDRMRRLIADHMVMSKSTSPHVTSFVEADVTNMVLWRERIKGDFEKREGQKITFTPIFIEAVARAIKDMPMINVSVNGTQIIKKKEINIGMATALPSGNLIVPVIKRADELNLIGLTKAVNDLAGRARNGKLKPDDTQGGTFTITNVGSFGNVMGTPIINQPQVAILAIGVIKKKPAVIETLEGDMIGIRHMMFLSLSYDHRVVDGSLGGSFIRRIADYLENWDTGRDI
ncbi:dihydrolipoamide acetyltransferase family protein [soil metagenome]|jgi:2-oxoglutarate dehydrogenase E2 component (dihydrolipoamide succinyltransferase)